MQKVIQEREETIQHLCKITIKLSSILKSRQQKEEAPLSSSFFSRFEMMHAPHTCIHYGEANSPVILVCVTRNYTQANEIKHKSDNNFKINTIMGSQTELKALSPQLISRDHNPSGQPDTQSSKIKLLYVIQSNAKCKYKTEQCSLTQFQLFLLSSLQHQNNRLFNQSACIIQYAFCHAWHLNFFRFFEDHLSSEKLLYF